MSLGRKIVHAESFPISKSEDYQNWRTRAVLGVQVEGISDWFYSVHMGWWDDAEEPFLNQWKPLETHISEKSKQGTVWLMGDFNAPDDVSDQSRVVGFQISACRYNIVEFGIFSILQQNFTEDFT